MRIPLRRLVWASLLAFPGVASAQPGGGEHAGWISGFHTPGMNGVVRALVSFDGQLIAAGDFTVAGGVDCAAIARWDGDAWHPLGDGLNDEVLALVVWRGELFAAGRFTFSGDVPMPHVGRWDGNSWHPVGEGMKTETSALLVFHDALVAGGSDLTLWDGTSWHTLGADLPAGSRVQAMIEFKRALVVAGHFDRIGRIPARSIASWDGSSWKALGAGFDRDVRTLAVHERKLIAGGSFQEAGGSMARALAAWDGGRWRSLGSVPGSFPVAQALAVHDGDLIVAGSFADPSRDPSNPVLRWDGRSWQPLGRGMSGSSSVFALLSDASRLFAGGGFADADGRTVNGLARFEDSRWHALSRGAGFDGPLYALDVFDGGLVAGGIFSRAGLAHTGGVAQWNGSSWEPMGAGLQGTVLQFARFRGELVAAGRFALDGFTDDVNVARWNGSQWESLGSGLNGVVLDLAVHEDELWAVGRFSASGSVPMAHIAAWNGQTWRGLPLDLDVSIGSPGMNALAVYDGALIVGGRFERINGLAIANLAARDRGIWYGFQQGVDEVVEDLVVHQGKLYVAGFFNYAGGLFAPQVAAWDSTNLQWSPAGTGLRFDDVFVPDAVLRLHSFGSDLILGGRFDGIDDVRAHNVARWDGTRWWPLGAGTDAPILALAHQGESLFVGGDFRRAGNRAAGHIAHWNRALPPPVRNLRLQVVEGRVLLQWELSPIAVERTEILRVRRGQPAAVDVELPGSPLLPAPVMRFVDAAPAPNTVYEYELLLMQHDGTEVQSPRVRIDTGGLERTRLLAPRVDASGTVEVHYSIGRSTPVEVLLFDVRGRLLDTLARGPRAPGEYVATWSRERPSGVRTPRGVYFLHLRAGTTSATRKMVLLD